MPTSNASEGRRSKILAAQTVALEVIEANAGAVPQVVPGLGRVQHPFDEQMIAESKHDMMERLVEDPTVPLRTDTLRAAGVALDKVVDNKLWRMGPTQDQGKVVCPALTAGDPTHGTCSERGFCVGAAWYGNMLAGPVMQRQALVPPIIDIYHSAQELGPWPGHDYAGTSTHAGAKALMKLGFISEFVWADSPEAAMLWIATKGPLVIGIDWTEAMFTPRKYRNDFWLEDTGPAVGGHALIVKKVNRKSDYAELLNSWGLTWARAGVARMKLDTLWRLVFDRGSDCAGIVENRVRVGPLAKGTVVDVEATGVTPTTEVKIGERRIYPGLWRPVILSQYFTDREWYFHLDNEDRELRRGSDSWASLERA